MALIRINDHSIWNCSASTFDALLDEAQKQLVASTPELADAAHSALDSRLHWWSLQELSAEQFCQFLRMVKDFEEKLRSRGPAMLTDPAEHPGTLGRVKDLSGILLADERSTGLRDGSS